ncbi:glycyl-tRNA synthetase [Rhizopus microsporus ATCC 52813]|uniref:glycine--tRNA ligase n=1 Tax=Rhizopus microsporus ATCC 52813 TaxID=1340429 RepID=A0A2G4SU47_RHIZD|nr:glycyl-tRNA synthetase [Rhizopus microsporus ATCC 52813]PHZ11916.1 glycyl-tRNA synthetase [Rhizopus microsporus ATCC 52813]
MAQKFRALLDLCRRRGFLYQSAEIYGGLRGAYDYGPLGVELKKNILNSWWRRHVYCRDDIVGIDTSIITPHPVLKASGHVDEFTDLLVDCTLTKERFRPDKAPELTLDKNGNIPLTASSKEIAQIWQKTIEEQLAPGIKTSLQGKTVILHDESRLPTTIRYDGYVEPNTNSPFLTASRPFNLMFKTFLDPIDPIDLYLRPETAQGVFVNFEQVVRTMKTKPPFGIAQVGKSFRNEIRLEHGIFRTPEFEQLELEYFVAPWESRHYFKYWRQKRFEWWLEHACHPEHFRQRDHEKNEMAHYATGCTDVEYLFPWGWGEVEGVAHRGDYDLKQHIKNSGAKFEIDDENPTISDAVKESGEYDGSLVPSGSTRYIPHVVESSCGLNRAMLAYLCDAFHQIEDENGKLPARSVLKLHPQLAPIKCAVMPLTGKPEFMPLTQKIAKSLRVHGWYTVVESQKLKIGKRYYRHDEIGTPWCITVDYQSLEDDTVTIRERDTGEQQRMHWKEVRHYVGSQLVNDDLD